MTLPAHVEGIALWCDLEGRILHVLRDELGILHDAVGTDFRLRCDSMSWRKLDRLLEAVRREQVVYDWSLNLPVAKTLVPLHVSAGRAGDRMLLIASVDSASNDRLYEELVRLSGDQATALRAALEDLAMARAQTRNMARLAPPDLDTFSQLNNELIAVQRELAKRNIQLERLDREKNRFVGMVAHDLRQPLGAIRGLVELLVSGNFGALDPRQLELLESIGRSSESMRQLIDDLLDVSVIESGHLELRYEDTDIRGLIRRIVGDYEEHALSKRIAVHPSFADSLPETVWLDPNRIAQVIGNLLSNAIKYSHADTEIRISATCAGELMRLEVADQGQGIPEAELEQLFKPFSRTSVRATAGESSTGLGLVIIKEVVRRHGGTISVTSHVGEGSRFVVTLPWQPAH